jgi:plastocyanin
MHSAALHLAPVLAAEKSKVPFFVAGGALAAWAVIVSVAFGLRREKFPSNLVGQRVVMAISAALVLAALSTAVITAGTPEKATVVESKSAAAQPGAAPPASPPASGPTSSSSSTTSSTAAKPATPPAATATSLKLGATGAQLAYNTKALSAKAGSVTIAFANPSPLEHNVTVASGSSVLGATPTFIGGTKSLTLTLKVGTYTFYCSVPGHRQAGMEGTLTVS